MARRLEPATIARLRLCRLRGLRALLPVLLCRHRHSLSTEISALLLRSWHPIARTTLRRPLVRRVRRDDRVRRFHRIVGDEQQIEIARRDLLLDEHARLEPAQKTGPVVPAEEDHRELVDLSRLDERERLERLIERPEAARKDDERGRVLHEHELANEEVAELDDRVDVRIRSLLEGEL